MNTPEGICLECGAKYAGWALENPDHRRCTCGVKIEIIEEKDEGNKKDNLMVVLDNFDHFVIDKQMSKRVNEIYGDPERHRFLSSFEAIKFYPTSFLGPRGGKPKIRKRICLHCGYPSLGHAAADEKL